VPTDYDKIEILGCLLIIVCFCLPAFTQTPDACRAAVQHLSLPSTIESPVMHPSQPLTPIKFLFSVEGTKDVYLATALRPPYPWTPMTDQPLTLVVVYQSEGERQKAISLLHSMGSGGILLNLSSPPLDNLKFAAVHCATTWKEFLSTGSCKIHDMQFYEPQACIVIPTANAPADLSKLAMLNPRNSRDVMNNFNWLNGFQLSPDAPVKKLEFPLAKLKEFAARNQ
jgi:hypothetical protein